MKPERRGGTERSYRSNVVTPLRDRVNTPLRDCVNTPLSQASRAASKSPQSSKVQGFSQTPKSSRVPGSCDHPSVLDLHATSLVSSRLAAVSEEKHTRSRARNQRLIQRETGPTTPCSQGNSVIDDGKSKRVQRTQVGGQQDRTDDLKKRALSISPARMSVKVRQKKSCVDTSKQECKANASTTRDTLCCVVDKTVPESPAHVNDHRKKLGIVPDEATQDVSGEDTMTEGVSTRELASAARKKFCQLDGQYTTDGRKVRMASSRFNRRKPQRKASLRMPQRKVSLRRPTRKVSVRGCKSVVKNLNEVKKGRVLSIGKTCASEVETDLPVLNNTESVGHDGVNGQKSYNDDINAQLVVTESPRKSMSSSEERQSPGLKRGLEVKPSLGEASSDHFSLSSTQSGHVSSAKKAKLDGKCVIKLVGQTHQESTASSVLTTARQIRLAESTSGVTTTQAQKVNISGPTSEFTINKVKKVRLAGPINELFTTPVHKAAVSGTVSELADTPVHKINVSGHSSELQNAGVSDTGHGLTSTKVQKANVSGPATEMTATLTQKVTLTGPTVRLTSMPVQQVNLPGQTCEITTAPAQKDNVSGPASELTSTPVQKVRPSASTWESGHSVLKVTLACPTSELTSTPVQKATASRPTTKTSEQKVNDGQAVLTTTPMQWSVRTPMRVHFSGLRDEPLAQSVRRQRQNKSVEMSSVTEHGSDACDAASVDNRPDLMDTSEDCQR